jgi:hypothetical protein
VSRNSIAYAVFVPDARGKGVVDTRVRRAGTVRRNVPEIDVKD